MKQKAFKTLLILIVSLFIFISCDPEEGLDPTNEVKFYIHNKVNKNLIIKTTFSNYCVTPDMRLFSINSDSLLCITSIGIGKDYSKSLFTALYIGRVVDDTIWFYSQDSVLLRMWTKFNNNEQNKEFFRESDWKIKQWKESDKKYIYTDYTFEILPEDLN
ncbi:MAG: hypothetical protein PHN41_05620 [Bacteroidales bacterium]|jgi:hypothetical protein|nr:hypothetical protein [Bacteroidales bacterium]MDD4703753.1 hypothetical protein [Bacteroidales bacterium]